MLQRSQCRYKMGRVSCLKVLFPCFLVTGLACIGVGLIFHFASPAVISSQINKKVTVVEGHATYEQLEDPTIPIYKDFYFFNLTNAEEFAASNGSIKPNLEELGPYSYREYRTKNFTGDSEDEDQITYTQQKIFFFDDNNSAPDANETDEICTINIPLVAAIHQAKDNDFMRLVLRQVIGITKAKLFICQEASNLAWGYTDLLLEALYDADQYPSKYVNLQVNNSINDSYPSIIHTGVRDISKIGQFVQWNNLTELNTWPNDGNETGANAINGTEGFFFRPNLKKGDGLTAFVDDIQRSMDLKYMGTVNPLGLKAFRYGIDNRTFKSAFDEPDNARWGSWCPDGMFYLGPTQLKEVPVFGSKPHFLDGDSRLLDSVVGLQPDRVKHDTVTDVEPNTGANLNFARQLQINVQVNKTDGNVIYPMHETSNIVGFNGTGVLYYPVLYVNERAMMDEDFKEYLEGKGLRQVQVFNTAVSAMLGLLCAVGIVFLLISMFACASHFVCVRGSDGTRTPLLNSP